MASNQTRDCGRENLTADEGETWKWSELDDRLKALRTAGASIQTIVDRLDGPSWAAVQRRIKVLNLPEPPASTVAWPDYLVAVLKALHGQGKSPEEIRQALPEPKTREAISAKLHRLGLTTPADKASPAADPAQATPFNPAGLGTVTMIYDSPPCVAFSKPIEPEPPPEVVGPCTIQDIRNCHCRWPLKGQFKVVGVFDVQLFCNEPAPEMGQAGIPPYCETHKRLAVQPKAVKAAVDKRLDIPTPLRVAGRMPRRFSSGKAA